MCTACRNGDVRTGRCVGEIDLSRISFLRHGATVAGARYCGSTDVPLSEEGWRQLQQAVEARHWTRIVSSPLQRCAAFAQALANARKIPCEIDARWRELHFGDWEGRSAAEIFAATPHTLEHFWRDPLACPPPNAETLHALRSRVIQACDDVRDSVEDEDVLVVTHAGPIRIVVAERDRLSLQNLLQIEVMHAQLIDVEADRTCVPS